MSYLQLGVGDGEHTGSIEYNHEREEVTVRVDSDSIVIPRNIWNTLASMDLDVVAKLYD